MLNFLKTKDPEKGASALLIAGSMVLIMGIAAVVIDGGLGFSERRQAQSAVDFAALAALQAAEGPTNVAIELGAAEAEAVVAENLPGRSLDWVACQDPEPLELVAANQCVSFTENLGRSRVYLPDDLRDTTFGNVIGFGSITVKAVAEAEAVPGGNHVDPFTPVATANGESCLYSNQAPQTVPPCNGPSSGFFGYLDLALYGSSEQGTPSTCQMGTPQQRFPINVTKSADHDIVAYDSEHPEIVNDFAECPNSGASVNQLFVQTG
ncbi:MAG TPA: Tad domain-containing protein, partial [Acidimicrobiia bacterium]|nr:Tad domain-containing protein [Acidimicrobiia bacterium]